MEGNGLSIQLVRSPVLRAKAVNPSIDSRTPINNEFGPVWRVTILSASRKGPSEDIHDVRSTAKRMIVSHKDSTFSSAISAQQCKITYHISFSAYCPKKKKVDDSMPDLDTIP